MSLSSSLRVAAALLFICNCLVAVSIATDLVKDVDIDEWGKEHVKVSEDGASLSLSLDKDSGSGFQTKEEYLFSRFDVELKLSPGYSAGVVTTFYLSSLGTKHDEIDFEFLGNVTGEPITLHTNIYSQGEGLKEKTYNLWYDPSEEYHLYSVVWNLERIVFMVDDKPIRVHNNHEKDLNLPYPTKQPMRVYASIWNGDDWATKGGSVKINWQYAPYVAHYRNLNITEYEQGEDHPLTQEDKDYIEMVEEEHMIYNYCDAYEKEIVRECDVPIY